MFLSDALWNVVWHKTRVFICMWHCANVYFENWKSAKANSVYLALIEYRQIHQTAREINSDGIFSGYFSIFVFNSIFMYNFFFFIKMIKQLWNTFNVAFKSRVFCLKYYFFMQFITSVILKFCNIKSRISNLLWITCNLLVNAQKRTDMEKLPVIVSITHTHQGKH